MKTDNTNAFDRAGWNSSIDHELSRLALQSLWDPSDLPVRVDEAISLARKLGDSRRLARALSIKSAVLLQQGDGTAALDAAHMSLRLAEGSGESSERINAFGALAVALSFSGAHSDALHMIEQAQCLSPHDGDVGWLYFRLGMVLLQGTDFAGANEALERATHTLGGDIRLPFIWRWRVSAMLGMERLSTANEYLQKAIFLAEHQNTQIYSAHLISAQVEMDAVCGKIDKARETIKDNTQKLGRVPLQLMLARLACTTALIRSGRFGEARKLLEEIRAHSNVLGAAKRLEFLEAQSILVNDMGEKAKRETVKEVENIRGALIELHQSAQHRATMISLELLEARLALAQSLEEINALQSNMQNLKAALIKKDSTVTNGSKSHLWEEAMRNNINVHEVLNEARLDKIGFKAMFQPIVDKRMQIFAFEALSRIDDKDGTAKLPHEFLIDLKHSDDCLILGDWILNECLSLVCEAKKTQHSIPTIFINAFERQLLKDGFASQLTARVKATLGQQGAVGLEIPEWAPSAENITVRGNIQHLITQGVPLSIGNFGVGVCNIADIAKLCPALVKFDRGLIQSYESKAMKAIVANIANIFTGSGIPIAQEGLETDHQRAIVAEMGILNGQGFLFAPPLSKAAVLEMFSRRSIN